MRDRVAKAVETYIDNHRDKLKDHVERNLEKLKEIIVEKLPDKIMDFIKNKVDDGDDENDTILENVLKVVTSLTDKLSDDFKEDIQGKEGIIRQIIELIQPPVHNSGEEINKEVSEKVPQHVKGNMIGTVGKSIFDKNKKNDDVQSRGIFSKSSKSSDTGEEEGGKKLSKILKIFGEGKDEGNFIDRLFAKLPARISKFIRPFIDQFEESLLKNIEEELRNNIFRDDKFKNDVKGLLLKFGGDSDGDGKNFFTEAADAVSSLFKKK
ncbi:11976_t:CDS:2 [Rhizophagus irregularis]|nr:11976_t:CDS:2 [Rhizophagus irregularis]